MPDTAPQPVLYLGDTALTAAAAYLAGVMHHAGIGFDYCPSGEKVGNALRAEERMLIILSDYATSQLTDDQHHEICAAVLGTSRDREGAGEGAGQPHAQQNPLPDGRGSLGTGLLMLGGWSSYHGQNGHWQTSPIADLLPVTIRDRDDRINHDQAALLRQVNDHPTAVGLPWDACPPCVGGYNRFIAKPGMTTVLEVVQQAVQREGDGFRTTQTTVDPMLVVADADGQRGRVACLATDAAPHWVGPFVDWGTDNQTSPSGGGRVQCQHPGANDVEVGQHYARFFTQLVRWAGSLEDQ